MESSGPGQYCYRQALWMLAPLCPREGLEGRESQGWGGPCLCETFLLVSWHLPWPPDSSLAPQQPTGLSKMHTRSSSLFWNPWWLPVLLGQNPNTPRGHKALRGLPPPPSTSHPPCGQLLGLLSARNTQGPWLLFLICMLSVPLPTAQRPCPPSKLDPPPQFLSTTLLVYFPKRTPHSLHHVNIFSFPCSLSWTEVCPTPLSLC